MERSLYGLLRRYAYDLHTLPRTHKTDRIVVPEDPHLTWSGPTLLATFGNDYLLGKILYDLNWLRKILKYFVKKSESVAKKVIPYFDKKYKSVVHAQRNYFH